VTSQGKVKTPSVEGEFNLTITALFIVIFCSDPVPLSVIKHTQQINAFSIVNKRIFFVCFLA